MIKHTIIPLAAAVGLTMTAHSQLWHEPEEVEKMLVELIPAAIPYWIMDETFLGIQLGDGQAARSDRWHPTGQGGSFEGDDKNSYTIALLGHGGIYDPNNIYIRTQAYLEAAHVRLGGCSVFRYSSATGKFLGNNPAIDKEVTPEDFGAVKAPPAEQPKQKEAVTPVKPDDWPDKPVADPGYPGAIPVEEQTEPKWRRPATDKVIDAENLDPIGKTSSFDRPVWARLLEDWNTHHQEQLLNDKFGHAMVWPNHWLKDALRCFVWVVLFKVRRWLGQLR